MNRQSVARELVAVAKEIVGDESPRRQSFLALSKKIDALRSGYPATSGEAIFLSIVRDMAVHVSRDNWTAVRRISDSMESEMAWMSGL